MFLMSEVTLYRWEDRQVEHRLNHMYQLSRVSTLVGFGGTRAALKSSDRGVTRVSGPPRRRSLQ